MPVTTEIPVTYAHKVVRTIPIEWDKLPEAAKVYIINYGLTKAVNDAHNGAKNEAEKVAAAEERWKRIMEGRLGDRAPAAKVPGWSVAEEIVAKAIKANKAKVSAADKAGLIKEYLAAHGDACRAEEKRRAAALPDMKVDLAGLAKK